MQTIRALCSPLVTLVFLQYHLAGRRAITSKEGQEIGYISCVLVVHETISELESRDLGHMLFAGVEKTDSWCAK
jgi:hypothetical protein